MAYLTDPVQFIPKDKTNFRFDRMLRYARGSKPGQRDAVALLLRGDRAEIPSM